MFHGAIQKIKVVRFMDHGVQRQHDTAFST